MTSYISRTEADELCDELIRQFVGGDTKSGYGCRYRQLCCNIFKMSDPL